MKEKSEVPLEGELISEELEIATPKVVRPEKKLHPAPKAQSGQQGLVMERIDTDKKEVSLQKGEKVAAPPVINALLDADLPEQAEQPKRALSGTLRGQKLTDTAPDYDDVIVIKGVVMDKNRDPLPGANVMLKGTSKGTITHLDGSYQLAINQRDSALPVMAGFIGYVSSEKSQSTDSITFMLEPELLAMDEVVVTGYGTAREQKIVTEDFVPAQPKAGLDAYIQSIERKLEYPASGSGKKETVVLWVTISEQGIITDIAIKRTPGDAYSDEAIKKLRQGPVWLPATQSGVPAEEKVKLKLQFRP